MATFALNLTNSGMLPGFVKPPIGSPPGNHTFPKGFTPLESPTTFRHSANLLYINLITFPLCESVLNWAKNWNFGPSIDHQVILYQSNNWDSVTRE